MTGRNKPSASRRSVRKRDSSQLHPRIRLGLVALLLIACLLGGGASRADVLSLLYVRPVAVICLAGVLAVPGRIDWPSIKVPLLLLGLFTLWTVLQLVPVPLSFWRLSAGHERVATAMREAALPAIWRPFSLAPDATLNSLAALTVAWAALISAAALKPEHRRFLPVMVLVGVLASALVAVAQVAGGAGALHFYNVTNYEAAVGLLANRNHQAVLLALAFPLLFGWASARVADHNHRAPRVWIAFATAMFLLPLILVTGSRAGLMLSLSSMAASYGLFGRRAISEATSSNVRWKKANMALSLLLFGCLLLIGILFAQAPAVTRLLGLETSSDLRVTELPQLLSIARQFMAVGSGLGTFDPVFRTYETVRGLDLAYLNHAHNDLLEVVITAGFPAVLLVLALLGWIVRRSFELLRGGWGGRSSALIGQQAVVCLAVVLLASLVDYPLRTPLFTCLFAFFCAWLGMAGRADVPAATKRAFTSPPAPSIG